MKKKLFAKKLIACTLLAMIAAGMLGTTAFAGEADSNDDVAMEENADEGEEDAEEEEEYEELEDLEYFNLLEWTDGPTELNIYNWGQYIADGSEGCYDIIEEFEKAYPDIHVNYMTFDSNETMYAKIASTGVDFDLIIPSDYMVEKLGREGLLEELDFSNIPNYALVDDKFKNQVYDPDNKYAVPYTWGYVGIIYNTKYVDEEDIGTWGLLWNEKYAGKILQFDNPRDAFAIAEHYLGYSLNTEDAVELNTAAMKLKEQKPLVQSYVMDQIFDKMEREEAWIAPYYAGDFSVMYGENEDLAFSVAKEGFNYFIDSCVIPKGAQHKKAAEYFINFICEPNVAAANQEYIEYATPISAAKEYMDEEMTSNEVIYPDDSVIEAGGEVFYALSDTGNQLMNDLWLDVKTANNTLLSYLIPVLVVVVILLGGWIFFSVRKKSLKNKRCTH